jgi:hypothetical protein
MTRYTKTAVTAKIGINYIRNEVEKHGSLFIKIEQDNDLGIDAIIELNENLTPINRQVAVQIKSGNSYYDEATRSCHFSIGTHKEYWSRHPLPVIGIVYIPLLDQAFWVDLKQEILTRNDSTIRFVASWNNQFKKQTVQKFIIPHILNRAPDLDIDEALLLTKSSDTSTHLLGLRTLFENFINSQVTWDSIIEHLLTRTITDRLVIYWLAHIPWNPDIYYSGQMLAKETKKHVIERLNKRPNQVIINLLNKIDLEQIGRGSLASYILSVLSCINGIPDKLLSIILRHGISSQIIHRATFSLAVLDTNYFIKNYRKIENLSPEVAQLLHEEILFNGYISISD